MMKPLFIAIAGLAFLPFAASAYDDSAIKIKCAAQWGSDFAMVKYCQDQQRQAGQTYDRLIEQAAENETVATIVEHCEAQWAKDYAMLVYCADQQSIALQTLSSKPQDVPEDVTDEILGQCAAQWDTDFAMVAYCVDRQTKSWRSLQ